MRLKKLEDGEELMKMNYNFDEKIAQKKKSIRALKRKYALKKRQERKIKLIKLGTLFSVTNLLEESQERIVAYLEKYLLLESGEKKKFLEEGTKLLKKETQSFTEKYPQFSRKKIFFLMIRKVALLEKLKLQMEDPKIILGYFSHYNSLSEIEKETLEKRGHELLPKHKKVTKGSIISDKEKIILLRFSIQHNVDITKILKEEYNATIHTLKKSELVNLLKKFNWDL